MERSTKTNRKGTGRVSTMEKKTVVFALTSSVGLANEIVSQLGIPLGQCDVKHFSDGEIMVELGESVRGKNVYIVQSTCAPVSSNIMEVLIAIDACKRASAAHISVVMPYFGYARQDRKAKARQPITSKLIADLLETAGANRVITMELHATQIQGFFDIPVDHLYASAVFLPYIQSLKLEDLVIATPDVGGSKRASTFSKYLGVPLVLCNKSREKANEVASMQIIGDVKDKNVVLIDDIVDTAGTITKAANIMLEAGAKSVRAIASHCVMSDPASFRVQESGLTEMVFTDSIPYAKKCAKVKQLSIADMFAETIKRVMNNESISSQYII